MSLPSVLYTGLALDRAVALRRDDGALAECLAGPQRRILPMWHDRHAVAEDGRLLTLAEAGGEAPTVFLGLSPGGLPWFASDLSALETPPDLGGTWRDLRQIGPLVAAADGALMAYARAMLGWHRRHRFCPVCGTPTEMREGGHLRLCASPACATPQFPRTDPAVIMLVTDDAGRALLGRQPTWPAGMVSTLAGFVEPGETLEQAVAREVAEETGVRVVPDTIRYVASQPWPFPASLMIAFEARAATTTVVLDPAELEDAAWYARDDVAGFRHSTEPGDGPSLPRRDSIASHLINRWLAG
jgi:NAD+ diphosphatase